MSEKEIQYSRRGGDVNIKYFWHELPVAQVSTAIGSAVYYTSIEETKNIDHTIL